MRGFLLYLPVTCLCAKLESCLLKLQPLFDVLLCTFCSKWARREGKGGDCRKGATCHQSLKWALRLSPSAPLQSPHRSCSPSVTNSHCRGSVTQFPDLVGCILLCKHSPLGLWNPKQHLHLHLSGERQNSPEISPQVVSVVCFWFSKQGWVAGGHRIWSCKLIVES